MPATGFLQIRAFRSIAQFPLRDVAITVTAADGTAIALGVTDRNGQAGPFSIPVPDKIESLSPDPEEKPFAQVNLYAHGSGYEREYSRNVQIFADTTTLWNIEMVPLSQMPGAGDQSIVLDTPPQNL